MSDLDNILSGVEAVNPEEAPKEEPKAEEPKVEQPEVKAEPQEEAEQAPKEEAEPKDIPYAVFKSTREDLKGQLDDARRRLDEIQRQQQPQPEPQKVPDIYEDAEGYQRHMERVLKDQLVQQTLKTSRFLAEREFGKDTIDDAVSFFDQRPDLSAQFLTHPSPYHAAVEFVKAQRAAAEIGADPEAYKSKLEQEIRQKLEAEMAAKQVTDMAQKRAPSMANVNGSGGQRDPGWQGPTPLDGLIGQ